MFPMTSSLRKRAPVAPVLSTIMGRARPLAGLLRPDIRSRLDRQSGSGGGRGPCAPSPGGQKTRTFSADTDDLPWVAMAPAARCCGRSARKSLPSGSNGTERMRSCSSAWRSSGREPSASVRTASRARSRAGPQGPGSRAQSRAATSLSYCAAGPASSTDDWPCWARQAPGDVPSQVWNARKNERGRDTEVFELPREDRGDTELGQHGAGAILKRAVRPRPAVYFSEAMSMTKRYFTSLASSRS